jgi:hypothetical protein
VTNYNASPNDPDFGTVLGTYMLVYRFIGAGWAIEHTRDMVIDLHYKMDTLMNPRIKHKKIAGRRRLERSHSETRHIGSGAKVRNPRSYYRESVR